MAKPSQDISASLGFDQQAGAEALQVTEEKDMVTHRSTLVPAGEIEEWQTRSSSSQAQSSIRAQSSQARSSSSQARSSSSQARSSIRAQSSQARSSSSQARSSIRAQSSQARSIQARNVVGSNPGFKMKGKKERCSQFRCQSVMSVITMDSEKLLCPFTQRD
uniref:Uncharacterized protein n=1 Tax=Pipistrellus kuhlii TaxID=59472 RepID=A0A7J7YMP9_PIPKU|nr:hypothetical protein mPipKuh1_010168 [Pipistrellus kuhlii]